MSDFRMSETALDVVSVPHLVTYPGTSPSVTFPMAGAAAPDVDELWAHLAESADFLGVAMPSRIALAAVLDAFEGALEPAQRVTALSAVTVTVVAGESRFVVTRTPVYPIESDSVRIDRCDSDVPLTVPEDPHWRRMAARTTSRADRDQLAEWLAGRGFADAVSARGVPFLGALVFECGAEFVGVDNPEPTSVLTQLARCGAVHGVRRGAEAPIDTGRVWWFSPTFARYPVSAIGDTAHPVSDDVPAFAGAA